MEIASSSSDRVCLGILEIQGGASCLLVNAQAAATAAVPALAMLPTLSIPATRQNNFRPTMWTVSSSLNQADVGDSCRLIAELPASV